MKLKIIYPSENIMNKKLIMVLCLFALCSCATRRMYYCDMNE